MNYVDLYPHTFPVVLNPVGRCGDLYFLWFTSMLPCFAIRLDFLFNLLADFAVYFLAGDHAERIADSALELPDRQKLLGIIPNEANEVFCSGEYFIVQRNIDLFAAVLGFMDKFIELAVQPAEH